MYINENQKVGDVQLGVLVQTLEEDLDTKHLLNFPLVKTEEIQALDFSEQNCYYMRTENGAEVIVSDSTPVPTREILELDLQDTDPLTIPFIFPPRIPAGFHVITDIGNGLEWSRLEEIYSIGHKKVAKLNCGGKNFAAGVKPGKYIYTHNHKIVK